MGCGKLEKSAKRYEGRICKACSRTDNENRLSQSGGSASSIRRPIDDHSTDVIQRREKVKQFNPCGFIKVFCQKCCSMLQTKDIHKTKMTFSRFDWNTKNIFFGTFNSSARWGRWKKCHISRSLRLNPRVRNWHFHEKFSPAMGSHPWFCNRGHIFTFWIGPFNFLNIFWGIFFKNSGSQMPKPHCIITLTKKLVDGLFNKNQ